jgi:hypothetical protein
VKWQIVEGKLCKISSYLDEEELRKFRLMVKARGITESMFIREMLGFDVRQRGAPKGPRPGKKAQAAKPRKSRPKDLKDKRRAAPNTARDTQLTLLD